jgi:hypothetical protein
MSERGTWLTEFIYCDRCTEAFFRFLEETGCMPMNASGTYPSESKYWSYVRLGDHAFAGRISGLHAGEELQLWEYDLLPKLEERLCHPLRIAVLADSGDQIFCVIPPPKPIPPEALIRTFTAEELAKRAEIADQLMRDIDSQA